MVHLERHEFPEALKQDLIHFALAPATANKFHELPSHGRFTEAYDIFGTKLRGIT